MDEEYFIFLNFPHNFSQDLRQGSDLENFFKYDKPTRTEPFALTPKQGRTKFNSSRLVSNRISPGTT